MTAFLNTLPSSATGLPALVALLLLGAPLVYLTGRLQLFEAGRIGPRRVATQDRELLYRKYTPPESLARWIALAVLLFGWLPFARAARMFLDAGPQTLMVEAIPLQIDGLAVLLAAVVLALASLTALFSGPYLAGEDGEEKYYAMLLAMTGVMVGLGCAGDLFNLWVWFEAMAVSSYLLVMFHRDEPAALEAGVKYVVQSAAGSVMVLMGIALVLAQTGTLDLAAIPAALAQTGGPPPAVLAAGALFLAGFGVKAALVPLHTWLPDAHSQAPSGISALLSGVVIEAGLLAMLRALGSLSGASGSPATWGALLMAFGALNMLLGNLMALRQAQVKRLLAYSSLVHVGYMLVGLGAAVSAGAAAGAEGGFFHLLTHALMKGLAFLAAGALLLALRSNAAAGHRHDPLTVADLDGAAQRYPLAALALSLALLSLGGLPPLAGFMSKWQIFVSGFTPGPGGELDLLTAGLVVFAALNSVLSLAYYAPLVNALYRRTPSPAVAGGGAIPWPVTAPLVVLGLAVVALGLWPRLAAWLTVPAGQALLGMFGG